MTLPWIPNQFVRNQVHSKRLAIETIILEQKDLVESLDETTENIKELKRDIEILNKDNELSFQELRRYGKNPSNLAAGDNIGGTDDNNNNEVTTDMESEEYAILEEEEEVLVQRIDTLEKSIQKSAMKRLGDRYARVCVCVCVCVGHMAISFVWFLIQQCW